MGSLYPQTPEKEYHLETAVEMHSLDLDLLEVCYYTSGISRCHPAAIQGRLSGPHRSQGHPHRAERATFEFSQGPPTFGVVLCGVSGVRPVAGHSRNLQSAPPPDKARTHRAVDGLKHTTGTGRFQASGHFPGPWVQSHIIHVARKGKRVLNCHGTCRGGLG